MTGHRFTNAVKLRLRQCVLDGYVQRLTTEEIKAYISTKLNIQVSTRYVEYLKSMIRRYGKNEFEKLRTDGLSYKLAFMDRIEEIKNLQRKQWDLFNEYKSPFLRHRCLIELRSLTETLTNLYDLLPAIDNLSNVRTEPKESIIGKPEPQDTNRVY